MNTRDRIKQAQRLLFFPTPSLDLSSHLQKEKESDAIRLFILASRKTITPSSSLTPFLRSPCPILAITAARVLYRRNHDEEAKTRLIQGFTQGDLWEAMEALEAFADLKDPIVSSAVRQRLAEKNEQEFKRRLDQLGLFFAPPSSVMRTQYDDVRVSHDLDRFAPPSWTFIPVFFMIALTLLPIQFAPQKEYHPRSEKAIIHIPDTSSIPHHLPLSPSPRRYTAPNVMPRTFATHKV